LLASYLSTGIALQYGATSDGDAFGLGVDSVSDGVEINTFGTGPHFVTSMAAVNQGWQVQVARVAASNWSLAVDGSVPDTGTDVLTTLEGEFSFGTDVGGVNPAEFSVAAALIYDKALSDLEIREVRSWLAAEFDLAGVL